jgi:hypothetical protein
MVVEVVIFTTEGESSSAKSAKLSGAPLACDDILDNINIEKTKSVLMINDLACPIDNLSEIVIDFTKFSSWRLDFTEIKFLVI